MSFSRAILRAAVAVPIALAVSSASAAVASATPAALYAFSGSAYGSSAKLGTLVRSGQTAKVGVCTTNEVTRSRRVAAVDLGVAGRVGAVQTTLTGTTDANGPTTITTASTGKINLLSGLITADALTSRAQSRRTDSGYSQSGSSTFTDLRIAGQSIAVNPAKNTRIALPGGLGSVVLNAQARNTTKGRHSLQVTAMRVSVNQSTLLGLPSGQIVLSQVKAMLSSPVHARPYGSAWATKARVVGGIVKTGATASVSLPCGGGVGHTFKNTTATVKVGTLVKTGATVSRAISTSNDAGTTATTQSEIADISLLGGVITLDAVRARASATRNPDNVLSVSTEGTTITNLKINGETVTVGAAPNTKIDIAGVGTLWMHRTIRSSTQIQVYAAQLQVLTDQVGGLDAGTTVSLGYARAGVAAS